MFQLYIRKLAQQDIQEAVDYYDEKSTQIADKFLEHLYAEFETITTNPELFQEKYKKTRVRYLKTFPFGFHYIIKSSTIEVLAVLHTSRNPKLWKSR